MSYCWLLWLARSSDGGGGTDTSEAGVTGAPTGLAASCPIEESDVASAPQLPSVGGAVLLLSSLRALLRGVLLSLGGSGGGAALSEPGGGSLEGGGADWWSEGVSADAASSVEGRDDNNECNCVHQ